jgi:hypothetical protein
MTLRGPDDDIRLTSGDIELIRGVLVACSRLLHWAERWGDTQFRAELHDAAQRAKGGRYSGYSQDTTADNASSPRLRTCGGYSKIPKFGLEITAATRANELLGD